MTKGQGHTLTTSKSLSVPALGGEQSLNRYLAEIKKFPVLTPEQEYMLAKRYQEHEDPEAAAQLVTSHLRLVAKIAMGYRGYGLPIGEVISEGNVGLMQAVKKFEPDKGFRLATYAMWWIKASIQEYILRSWSLVKMGTTANQKKPKPVGAATTPTMNSRIVRPREMRATNMPTNGAQEIHQAQ